MVQATEVWHRQNYKEGASSSTEKQVASIIWSERRKEEAKKRRRRDTKNFLRPKVPGRQHGANIPLPLGVQVQSLQG